MADTPDDTIIDFVSQHDTLAKLIENVGSSELTIFVPALRAVGNIMTTNDPSIIERCIFCGVLEKLTAILF
jgi:hypothetical protein